MPVQFEMSGFEAAEAAVRKAAQAARPEGGLGQGITYATVELHRYAQNITHVWTGALQSAHRMRVTGTRGLIFVEGGVMNPITRLPVSSYVMKEHEKGGSHAFYQRTVTEAGPGVAGRAMDLIKAGLP